MDGVISSEYPNKILTLRHFYSGDRLHLYADGTLVDDAPAGTWTSDGQVEVRDASLNGSVLSIKGRRIYQVYDAKSKQFVDALSLLPTYPEKQQKDLERMLRRRQVEIQIEMPPTPDPREIPETLHAVFLAPYEPVSAVVPVYYHDFFANGESASHSVNGVAGVVRVVSPGDKPGQVSPPHAASTPAPEYSEAARQLKYQGTVVISLVVDPSGAVRNPQIAVPLGLGLDDKAIAAVSQWKFDPAQKDGKPVAAAIGVQVEFKLK
jgi:TonB family protein